MEGSFVVEVVISSQQLVSLQLGDDMCLGGALFVPTTSAIHCWHYDQLGDVILCLKLRYDSWGVWPHVMRYFW